MHYYVFYYWVVITHYYKPITALLQVGSSTVLGRALIIFVWNLLVSGFSKIISKTLRQVNFVQIQMTSAKIRRRLPPIFIHGQSATEIQRSPSWHQRWTHLHFCCLPNIHAPVLKISEARFLASFTSGSFSWFHWSLRNTEGTGFYHQDIAIPDNSIGEWIFLVIVKIFIPYIEKEN